MKIRVYERFTSYQGTGVFAGAYQDFVRFAGCSVKCPLRKNCDHQPSHQATGGMDLSIDEILGGMTTNFLHVTGGEPAESPLLVDLCDEALNRGMQVQVQTSGAIPIKWRRRPFVSVSPKQRYSEVLPDEILLVATKWVNLEFALSAINRHMCPVYVVPEAINGKFEVEAMMRLLTSLRDRGVDARAGLQAHLVWGVL